MDTEGSINKIDKIANYMRVRKEIGPSRYHLLLVSQPDMQCSVQGYRALVRLLKANYFATILTIGCEEALEQAWIDLAEGSSGYRKLVVGRDDAEHIVDALYYEGSECCVIVLDQLKQQEYAEGEEREESATTYQTSEIQEALQYYFNQEIIIAGSIEHEKALLPAFLPQKENVIHCVLPGEALLQQHVSAILERRGKSPIFIPEPYNTFDDFFTALCSSLLAGENSVERKITTNALACNNAEHVALPPPVKQPRRKQLKADLLLVTATKVETEAVLAHATQKSRVTIRNRAYHNLDVIGGAKAFLVQLPAMGYSGSGGSLKTIEEAIHALSPWAVIMIGIAFGFDPQSQQIGDILISQQLQDYDSERVGSESGNQLRGVRVNASASLLSNFITNQYYVFEDWPDPPTVYSGLILSGSKLVDNEQFRNQLRMAAPNAVGGEMEGMGLYEAASNKHVEWLLVKAISDWGDGKKHVNKKEYQQLATKYVARFTIKVIELGGFTRPSRR